MDRIKGICKQTDNPYLNLYAQDVRFRDGSEGTYYVASRRKTLETLKSRTHCNDADGVVVYGIYGDRIVLIRQYRYPIDGYVYELPSGIVEPGEDIRSAAIREMYEETGLTFRPEEGGSFCRPFYTSVGMSDESCATVYGRCEGVPTNCHQEGSEDIEVVLADREECRRILKEEQVAIMCAYQLMHFIASDGDPLKFLDEAL